MTVSTASVRLSYAGDGTTKTFAVGFYFLDNTHLALVLVNTSTGVSTSLTLNTDYTVSGAGVTSGGSVTLTTAPTSSYKLVITRNIPLTQETSYQPNDPFPAKTHEAALDKLTMIDQQVADTIGRALVFPVTDSVGLTTILPNAAARANKYLTFDSAGLPAAYQGVTDVTTVAGIATQVNTLSAIATNITTVATNITAVNNVNSNLAAVNAAVSSASAAAASATSASTYAGNASTSATQAAASATAAQNTVAAAKIPTILTGYAGYFLQINQTADGYNLVNSVAAPGFFGFNLSSDKASLVMDTGRTPYDQANYAASCMSENVTFQVVNNQLVMVLL